MRFIAMLLTATLLCLCAAQKTLGQDKAPDAEAKPGTKQADRRAEGEKLLGSMRDQARVAYAMLEEAPKRLTGDTESGGCSVEADVLQGDFCKIWDTIYTVKDKADDAALIAEDTVEKDGFAIMTFHWERPDVKIEWYNTLADLKKAHEEVDLGKTVVGKDEMEDGDSAAAGEADPYFLYKKEGRSWTLKYTTTIPGMDPMVSYMKTEVTEVAADHALTEMTMMDKDKKPMAGMEPTETKIAFIVAPPREDGDLPDFETTDETISVEGGEFECTLTEVSGTKVWMAKKYPGLVVKLETQSTVGELIEFNE